MPVNLTFLGAAGSVTGSRYLLETPDANILVDAGMFQERANQGRNWENFGLDPRKLDAVLLTHGHLDHCGWLPKLVKDGFAGPVYATPATCDLVPIILRDTARIQMEDAKTKAKRHAKEDRAGSRPIVPLYDIDDAEAAINRLKPAASPGNAMTAAPGLTAEWGENGHILGAGWIRVRTNGLNIVFSGDVGRWDRPILHDPKPPTAADYLIIESTYGDREHEPGDQEARMAEVLDEAAKRGGNVIVPSFSVERAQELLYLISRLAWKKSLPFKSVYVDSPMASRVTELFGRHPEELDEDMRRLIASGTPPFSFPGLTFVASAEDSKRLNNIRKGSIIIAGNGMCTGGRVKHHLLHNLEWPQTTVLFVGFQSPGTLGRQLVDGAAQVRLFNRQMAVRAAVRQLPGMSGHADRNELARWAGVLGTKPRHCFVTHGDPEAAAALSGEFSRRFGWETSTPKLLDKVELT